MYFSEEVQLDTRFMLNVNFAMLQLKHMWYEYLGL